MAFPASVEHVRLTRPRPGGRFKIRDDEVGTAGHSDYHDADEGLGFGGPVLDFGREGAARLEKSKSAWRWDWVKQEPASHPSQTLRLSKPVLQYPSNRMPDPDLRDVPMKKAADAAVDYVRALPDVSGYASISDLIIDELGEAGKLPARDVYQGDALAVIHNARAKTAKVLLAFPVGQVGNQLCISPFLLRPSRARRDRPNPNLFRPDSVPSDRLPTAILQLSSSPYQTGLPSDGQCTALMVRIQVSTIMLMVDPYRESAASDSSDVRTTRLGELHMSHTEGRRHVDMALDETSWCKALIVDEGGGVWLWQEEKHSSKNILLTKSMKLTKIRDAVSDERHGFYRVAFGSSPGTALVMSAKDLTVIDYEDPAHASTILIELTGRGRTFAAMEKSALTRRASLTCVATNLEVLWVDELKAGSPVLTWKHDIAASLQSDLTLTVLHVADRERIHLSCRPTGLSVVFDVDAFPPARSRQPPVILAMDGHSCSDGISAIVPLSLSNDRQEGHDTTHLVTLNSDGSLYISSLELRDSEADVDMEAGHGVGPQAPEPVWSQDIQAIAAANSPDGDEELDANDKALTKHKVYDMRWVWQELNEERIDQGETFTFDSLHRYVKELDAPFDNIATLGDLARDAVAERETQLRTHALTPLPVDQYSAKEAIDGLGSFEPSLYDLTTINTCRDDKVASTSRAQPAPVDLEQMTSTFHRDIHGMSAAERRRIDLDIRRLVLDLVLSRTAVHSDAGLAPQDDAREAQATSIDTSDALFQATQQLTLDESSGGAKQIEFRFLVPRKDIQADIGTPPNPGGAPDIDVVLQTSSARRLLSEWAVGSDPGQYTWTDWRGPESRASTPLRRPVRPLPSPRATQRFAQSQGISGKYAPTIAASQTPFGGSSTNGYTFPGVGLPVPSMRSSPPPVLQSSQSLQDPVAATQVERGPFGGRLDGKVRKKPTKKRVGGF